MPQEIEQPWKTWYVSKKPDEDEDFEVKPTAEGNAGTMRASDMKIVDLSKPKDKDIKENK